MTGAVVKRLDGGEQRGRVDLAAAFRLTARFGWHESVANHFSLALDPEGRHILINPRWRHFARIRASDLLLLDVEDPGVMRRPDAPDPTAWCIHGALHRLRPEIRCVLHTHMPYATALTSLEDSRVLPIDQNCARFYGRIAYDEVYGGFATAEDEGRRIAEALGDKPIAFLKNHGVIVTGRSVAEAFDELYSLEQSCRQLVLAYSTGRPLRLISDNLATQVAAEWMEYEGFAQAHFSELKALLDAEDPSYAQ
ncbi:MAG: class II aldolase/adducin family protein [Geminicoccaceae bacterium]